MVSQPIKDMGQKRTVTSCAHGEFVLSTGGRFVDASSDREVRVGLFRGSGEADIHSSHDTPCVFLCFGYTFPNVGTNEINP